MYNRTLIVQSLVLRGRCVFTKIFIVYISFAQNVNRASANNNYYRLLIAVNVYELINNLATLERDSSEFLQKYNDSI